MAKQMNSKLPSVENYKGPTVEKPDKLPNPPAVARAAPQDTSAFTVENAEITLPIGPRSNGNLPRNCFIRLKGEQQKRALQRLRLGLVESQARLKNGTAVSGNSHALQWVLEQIELT